MNVRNWLSGDGPLNDQHMFLPLTHATVERDHAFMAIPDCQTLMLPVLRAAADGEARIGEVVQRLSDKFGLTADLPETPLDGLEEVAIMESSTIWTALDSIAAWVSSIAIVVAVYQLWFNAWLKAQDVFTEDSLVSARKAVFAHFDDPQQPWPDPRSNDARKVCRKMDEMAGLVPFLGRKKVLQVWSNPIAKAWLLLKPTVDEERCTSHWDGKQPKWRKFEELGKDAVRRNPELEKLRRNVQSNTALSGTEME